MLAGLARRERPTVVTSASKFTAALPAGQNSDRLERRVLPAHPPAAARAPMRRIPPWRVPVRRARAPGRARPGQAGSRASPGTQSTQ